MLELTLIRFFWTFNLNFDQFVLAGVIWMLGWCMILMSTLIYLRPAIIGTIGIFIIAFQEVFSLAPKLFLNLHIKPSGIYGSCLSVRPGEAGPRLQFSMYLFLGWE